MPILFKPQQTKKFLISGTSPNKVLVSGVKDSGPEKNFLIPVVSKIGNLLTAVFRYGSKCSKFSWNSPKEKFSGTILVLSQAGIELPSNIPTNIFPASSFI